MLERPEKSEPLIIEMTVKTEMSANDDKWNF